MYTLNVTEFRLPNGSEHELSWEWDGVRADKAKELADAGYVFQFEVLRNDVGSATVTDPELGDREITLMSPKMCDEFAKSEGVSDDTEFNPIEMIFRKCIDDAHANWLQWGKPKVGEEWLADNRETQAQE